jgi:hypothetical protein
MGGRKDNCWLVKQSEIRLSLAEVGLRVIGTSIQNNSLNKKPAQRSSIDQLQVDPNKCVPDHNLSESSLSAQP